ncbi:aldehyde dehydrogenase family protein, partial [Streptomyces hundungensis]|uniref:aldehyde dehydrogenase family protein n=1 Tax=Streptomyces hundungensis TaxID=1077946 RepID=UPI0033CA9DD5
MKAHDGMYIDGEWRAAAGRDTIAVLNPVDEQVIDHVPAGTAEDVDAAVRAARAAHTVLRGLTSSSGGMVAAATTSLPERAEAGRNY